MLLQGTFCICHHNTGEMPALEEKTLTNLHKALGGLLALHKNKNM